MNDRELLEAAAKAAGYAVEVDMNWGTGGIPFFRLSGAKWSPLTDDGDALRLAVKLVLLVNIEPKQTYVSGEVPSLLEKGDDSYANTRRAIVRAAAEIGAQA